MSARPTIEREVPIAKAKPCPHGSEFITLCEKCTPPLEKKVGARCDKLMRDLGWTVVNFSQPFRAAQTSGIPDRRYYPPENFQPSEWAPVPSPRPFWMELKRSKGWTTNAAQKKSQSDFQEMCRRCGEDYVRGGESEIAAHLRKNFAIEVGPL